MHDLDDLTAFDAVMVSGSLTRSARDMGLAKSTLSRRIQQLEQRLGQPLMRRQSNKLVPTEAGIVYHRYCIRMLELAKQGRQALDALHEDIRGELVLEVHDCLTRSWVSDAIDAFIQRHPSLSVSVLSRSCLANADENAVAIWFGEPGETSRRQEHLAQMPRGLYAHPDYLARHGQPHHPEELSHHTWVSLLGEAQQELQLTCHHGNVHVLRPPTSRLKLNCQRMHSDAIARGRGLGVLPLWLAAAREATHPGQLVRCLPDWQANGVPISLLYPHGHRPRKLDALLDTLRSARPGDIQHSLT